MHCNTPHGFSKDAHLHHFQINYLPVADHDAFNSLHLERGGLLHFSAVNISYSDKALTYPKEMIEICKNTVTALFAAAVLTPNITEISGKSRKDLKEQQPTQP